MSLLVEVECLEDVLRLLEPLLLLLQRLEDVDGDGVGVRLEVQLAELPVGALLLLVLPPVHLMVLLPARHRIRPCHQRIWPRR